MSASGPDGRDERLGRFVDLLLKWNRVYNLTSIRDRGGVIERHVDDCLACVEPLSRRWPPAAPCRILDVGSGGGLPGVVIAIALPHVAVTCVDTVGKKAAFIQQVASTLGLKNVRSMHVRAEDVKGEFEVIASRAFSSLKHLVEVSEHALAVNGDWMAMKGVVPVEELAELDNSRMAFHVEQLPSESMHSRCLVWIHRKGTSMPALAHSQGQ